MDPILLIIVVCVGLGAMVGFLAGLLGIGGGLIMVPALLYMFQHTLSLPVDVAMPMAIATSLSTILFTGASSAKAHYRLGNLHAQTLTYTAPGIALGAFVGAQIAVYLDGELLKSVFAGLVLLIAAKMALGGKNRQGSHTSLAWLFSFGLLAGLLSAIMGIGGGAILVPMLVWLNIPLKQAIGCAAASGIVIALFGTSSFIWSGYSLESLPYWSFGYVFLPATLGIVVTSIFTAGMGAKYSAKLDTAKLKKIFAIFLVLVSLRMLLD